jgi:hypothetical protein
MAWLKWEIGYRQWKQSKIDGFLKSPSVRLWAGLRFIFSHCDVLVCTPHSWRFAPCIWIFLLCRLLHDSLRTHENSNTKWTEKLGGYIKSRVFRVVLYFGFWLWVFVWGFVLRVLDLREIRLAKIYSYFKYLILYMRCWFQSARLGLKNTFHNAIIYVLYPFEWN